MLWNTESDILRKGWNFSVAKGSLIESALEYKVKSQGVREVRYQCRVDFGEMGKRESWSFIGSKD